MGPALRDGDPEAAPRRVAVDHAPSFVRRGAGGGFTIETEGRPSVRVESSGDAWRIEGPKGLAGWLLHRVSGGDGGFVLRNPETSGEVARTMPLVGARGTAGPRYLLLDDGRLFRMVLRGPRADGIDLTGWETPGAYLTARPEKDGWSLVPTPACSGLEDIQVLSIMLAVEVLDAEEPLRPE